MTSVAKTVVILVLVFALLIDTTLGLERDTRLLTKTKDIVIGILHLPPYLVAHDWFIHN